MRTDFDVSPASVRLMQARREQRQFDVLPEDERPETLEEGYAIQAAVHAALGATTAGYKVAAANVAALRASEFGLALFGTLDAPAMLASGATVGRVPGSRLTLEVEVAFELLRDADPTTEALDAGDMFGAPFVAFEIVRSRYLDRKVVGAASFVADNSAFHAFVRGEPLVAEGQDNGAPWSEPAVLMHDGKSISTALKGEDCTEPLRSLALFWEHAAKYGLALKRGQVVTTGTLVQPTDVDAPGRYEGRVGRAAVAFTLV